MTHRPKVSRREFSRKSVLVLLAGVPVAISACGDSSGTTTTPTPSTPPPAPTGDISGSVSANHGHAATVTSAQLGSGSTVTLDIQGTSNHPHTVELTVGELSQIRNGTRVSKSSSVDQSHDHIVTFN